MRTETRSAPALRPPLSGQSTCFIYYRIHPADEVTVLARLAAVHDEHRRRWLGLRITVMRRMPLGEEQQTMMETYTFDTCHAAPPTALDELLADCALALQGLTIGARHMEVFEPCA